MKTGARATLWPVARPKIPNTSLKSKINTFDGRAPPSNGIQTMFKEGSDLNITFRTKLDNQEIFKVQIAGNTLFAASETHIHIWDLMKGTQISSIKAVRPHMFIVQDGLLFCTYTYNTASIDETNIADIVNPSLNVAGDSIIVVDISTGKIIRKFKGHSKWITSFQTLNSILYTCSADGTTRFWKIDKITWDKINRGEIYSESSTLRESVSKFFSEYKPASSTNENAPPTAYSAMPGNSAPVTPEKLQETRPSLPNSAPVLRSQTLREDKRRMPSPLNFKKPSEQLIRLRGRKEEEKSANIPSTAIITWSKSYPLSCITVNREFVATGSVRALIFIWNKKCAKEIATLQGHSGVILHLIFYNNVLFSSSKDMTIRSWSIEPDFKCIHIYRTRNNNLEEGQFTLYQNYLFVISGYNSIRMHDTTTSSQLREFKGTSKSITCFTLHNEHIFIASDDSLIRQYLIATGEIVRIYRGHVNEITSLTIQVPQRGEGILYSSSLDGTVKGWMLTAYTKRPNNKFQHTKADILLEKISQANTEIQKIRSSIVLPQGVPPTALTVPSATNPNASPPPPATNYSPISPLNPQPPNEKLVALNKLQPLNNGSTINTTTTTTNNNNNININNNNNHININNNNNHYNINNYYSPDGTKRHLTPEEEQERMWEEAEYVWNSAKQDTDEVETIETDSPLKEELFEVIDQTIGWNDSERSLQKYNTEDILSNLIQRHSRYADAIQRGNTVHVKKKKYNYEEEMRKEQERIEKDKEKVNEIKQAIQNMVTYAKPILVLDLAAALQRAELNVVNKRLKTNLKYLIKEALVVVHNTENYDIQMNIWDKLSQLSNLCRGHRNLANLERLNPLKKVAKELLLLIRSAARDAGLK